MSEQSLAERTKELQREIILNTAAKLFAEEGSTAVTMRKIAANSKTSTTVLYSLFGNKMGIIEALFAEAYTIFQERIRTLNHDPGDDMAMLLQACETLWEFSIDFPHYYRIIHGSVFPGILPVDFDENLPRPHPRDLVLAEIDRLKEKGLFPRMDHSQVMVSMYSLAVGMINSRLNGLFPTIDINKEFYLSNLRNALTGIMYAD